MKTPPARRWGSSSAVAESMRAAAALQVRELEVLERLGGVEVTRDPHAHPVSDLGEIGVRRDGLGPADLALGAELADRGHAVTVVADLPVLEVDLVQDLGEVTEHPGDPLVPAVDLGALAEERRQGGMPAHLGIELLEQGRDVAAVVCVDGATEQGDVLLGHRRPVSTDDSGASYPEIRATAPDRFPRVRACARTLCAGR